MSESEQIYTGKEITAKSYSIHKKAHTAAPPNKCTAPDPAKSMTFPKKNPCGLQIQCDVTG